MLSKYKVKTKKIKKTFKEISVNNSFWKSGWHFCVENVATNMSYEINLQKWLTECMYALLKILHEKVKKINLFQI